MNNSNSTQLYSIGYATKPIEIFVMQLKRYRINAVADIRSVPYSKFFHDYHQEKISAELIKNKIKYIYLGGELGPRSKDTRHYDQCGQVQFDRLMNSELFLSGVQRLKNGIQKNFNIALMCAEKDPSTCHRSLLVGYYLAHHAQALDMPKNILHINHNGELETQHELESRLMSQNSKGEDLFTSNEEAQLQAYKAQLRKTSYINENLNKDNFQN